MPSFFFIFSPEIFCACCHLLCVGVFFLEFEHPEGSGHHKKLRLLLIFSLFPLRIFSVASSSPYLARKKTQLWHGHRNSIVKSMCTRKKKFLFLISLWTSDEKREKKKIPTQISDLLHSFFFSLFDLLNTERERDRKKKGWLPQSEEKRRRRHWKERWILVKNHRKRERSIGKGASSFSGSTLHPCAPAALHKFSKEEVLQNGGALCRGSFSPLQTNFCRSFNVLKRGNKKEFFLLFLPTTQFHFHSLFLSSLSTFQLLSILFIIFRKPWRWHQPRCSGQLVFQSPIKHTISSPSPPRPRPRTLWRHEDHRVEVAVA